MSDATNGVPEMLGAEPPYVGKSTDPDVESGRTQSAETPKKDDAGILLPSKEVLHKLEGVSKHANTESTENTAAKEENNTSMKKEGGAPPTSHELGGEG